MNTMSGCHFSPPQQVNSDRSNSYSGSIQNPRPVHSNTFDFKPEKGDQVRAALRPLAGALVEQPADLDDLMVCKGTLTPHKLRPSGTPQHLFHLPAARTDSFPAMACDGCSHGSGFGAVRGGSAGKAGRSAVGDGSSADFRKRESPEATRVIPPRTSIT